jgi:hypothetical protein
MSSEMKIGDLVRYKVYPHSALRHMLGLVENLETESASNYRGLRGVYVVWNQDRNRGPANTIMWEFVDELEVIDEGR